MIGARLYRQLQKLLKNPLFLKAKEMICTRKAVAFGGAAALLAIFAALGYEYVQLQPKNHFKKAAAATVSKHVSSAAAQPPRQKAVTAFNLLLIGSDQRAGESIGHSDAVMLLHIDMEKNQVYAVSLPRDLRVDLDGYGYTKLASVQYILQANHGTKQGIADTVKVISRLTGVPISYYAETDFNGLTSIVNALGGISVKVPGKAGSQGSTKVDGKTALSIEHGINSFANADYGRQQLQLGTLIGMAKKAVSMDSLPRMTALDRTVSQHLVASNLSPSDLLSLWLEMKTFDPDRDFHYRQFSGVSQQMYDDVLKAVNDEIVMDPEKLRGGIAGFFGRKVS